MITNNLFVGLGVTTGIFVIGWLYFESQHSNESSTSKPSNHRSSSVARSRTSRSNGSKSSSSSTTSNQSVKASYDQNIAYQVDYGDRCHVCYYYSYKDSHKCAVTVRTTVKTFTVTDEDGELENVYECTGCLYDGLGQIKWQCGHKHPNVTLATKCAREHYKMHQRGSCNCAYFARPIPHGLSNKSQAQLYLIKHERFNALKVGVSNSSTNDRLEEHLTNGWVLVAVWKGVNGRKAYEQEQATIASWRKQGYGIAVSWKNMPQKGATETVSLANISEEDIATMIEDFTVKFKYKPTTSL